MTGGFLNRFVEENIEMEKGVWVVVKDKEDRFYGKVGRIVKQDGLSFTVQFGLFNRKKYRARYLQTLKRL